MAAITASVTDAVAASDLQIFREGRYCWCFTDAQITEFMTLIMGSMISQFILLII